MKRREMLRTTLGVGALALCPSLLFAKGNELPLAKFDGNDLLNGDEILGEWREDYPFGNFKRWRTGWVRIAKEDAISYYNPNLNEYYSCYGIVKIEECNSGLATFVFVGDNSKAMQVRHGTTLGYEKISQ